MIEILKRLLKEIYEMNLKNDALRHQEMQEDKIVVEGYREKETNELTIWAYNNETSRPIDLMALKYKKLREPFNKLGEVKYKKNSIFIKLGAVSKVDKEVMTPKKESINLECLDKILNRHSKSIDGILNEKYNIGSNIEVVVVQTFNELEVLAKNIKTNKAIDIGLKKYGAVIERFNIYSEDTRKESNKYMIRLKVIDGEVAAFKTIYELTSSLKNEAETIKEFPTKELLDNYLEIGREVNLKVNNIREIKPLKVAKVIGYCRVSTKGQLDNNSLQQQEEIIIAKYPGAQIEKEQFTGVISDRPILNRVVSKVSKGDTIVVSKLDRLARNTKEGIEIIEKLFSKGVAIHALNVGLLEDTTMGRFFLTTMLAVAEMERNMILERTQAGKEIARTKSGFKEGRPKKFKKVNIDYALGLLSINGGNMSYTEVANATSISKSTLIRENNQRK